MPLMLTATAHTPAPALLERLDAPELGALLDAVDDRLETAAPDLVAILSRGRAALELELADRLAE